MSQDDRADHQQQAQDDERRYLEAHPDYERCPRHPERDVVDSSVATYRYCAECIATHREFYADQKRDTWPDDGISAWIHGAGDRPSDLLKRDKNEQ